MSPAPLRLTIERARRLSVAAQLLSAPRPRTIEEVVRGLGEVQVDPTSAVARTEHLVLWSRLGSRFRVADLERMLWDEHSLFEYRAHIVHVDDFAIHRESMRRFAGGLTPSDPRRSYWRDWMDANAAFRRYVLRELRRRGPLRTRDLEDRAVEGWQTGGWNDDGKSTAMMLELLWARGEVMIAGRDGQQRLWDLAERCVPVDRPRLSKTALARRVVEAHLLARGVGTPRRSAGRSTAGPPGGSARSKRWRERAWRSPCASATWMVRGTSTPTCWTIRSVHARRSLSPFDDLVSDRDHTEQLFGFRFRLEIYVPKAKREFGYFVLPILHGDRLIGRIDPRFDRATGVLHVNAVYAEDGAPADAGVAVRRTIEELGRWRGATDIRFTRKVPTAWRNHLT